MSSPAAAQIGKKNVDLPGEVGGVGGDRGIENEDVALKGADGLHHTQQEGEGDHGADAAHEVHEVPHSRVMRYYAERPRTCFAVACGVQFFLVLLVLILQSSMGSDFINQSTGVALHIWDNEWYVAIRADDEGQKICTYDSTLETGQRQQEIKRLTAGLKEYTVEVIYVADTGEMLNIERLSKMKELEDWLVSRNGYANFCLREAQSTECALPISAMVACDVTVSSGNDCSSSTANPPGYAQCSGATAAECYRNRALWSLERNFIEQKTDQLSDLTIADGPYADRALTPFSASFGGGGSVSPALFSEFEFGFPLPGYADTSDDAEGQAEKTEEWLEDEVFERLDEFNNEEADDAGFQIGFSGAGLDDLSINALLARDFLFVGLAFVVVWAYVALMAESIFLATFALLQVFLCFAWGLILYRIIYGSFFGTFHIMAIFLLVGIGVDGVFVMNDHFAAAVAHNPDMLVDLWARISWTWKYAGNALTVTSLTTAVSFLLNATSVFYGIAAFGTFAAMLIVANYFCMLFFFPAVLTFNLKVFSNTQFLCGIPKRLNELCKNTSKEQQEVQERNEQEEKSALVRFFENQFANFILGHRVKVIVVFIAVSIFMFIQLPKLTAEKGSPQLLPDDHPVRLYESAMKEYFVRGGSVFNTEIQVMFGFDHNPLSGDDLDESGEGFGDKDDIGTQGKVRWAPTWYTDDAQTQSNYPVIGAGFDCVIQLCNSAEIRNNVLNTGGPPAYRVQGCFPRDLQNFIAANPQLGYTWAGVQNSFEQAGKAIDAMLDDTSGNYMSDEDFQEYTFAERVNGQPLYRFFKFELRLTSSTSLETEDGLDLADAWKSWLNTEMSQGSCLATRDTFWGLLNVPDFHQFHVQDNLISEMFSGITIAIIVALIVLNISTGNIIVGFLAALSIGMIVIWVMATIPLNGWELGILENIALVMVPGLSVDYVAHLAEAFIHAKFDEREHRVIAMLEHSGVSVLSGSISTLLAGGCLLMCKILFFTKFGLILITTICFSLLWSLFCFPAVLALIGPTGVTGDWLRIIHPCLQPAFEHVKLRGGEVKLEMAKLGKAKSKEMGGGRVIACSIL